jgi:predicted MPP superfamily phosphohydrolase
MPWVDANPDDVIILHLSDLHFGAKNQTSVFEEITPFLQNRVKPDIVLITGDVVDSPQKETFIEARRSMQRACPGAKLFMCGGNHDRFRKGNRFRFWSTQPSPLMRDELHGHHLSPAEVRIEPIKGWKIGFIEIDSAKHADYAARGYVTRADIDTAVAAAKHADCDICIALTHHHPLPVRELEATRRGKLRDLARVTSLVNAGTLLEAVANANIDIILHGHEHMANWGRYGSLELGRGEVCILGAGSGTGNHSIDGCQISSVSFNVITLAVDRTVRARIVSYKGDWHVKELSLFDAATVRRRRLLRRLAREGEVLHDDLGTEITKSVRFTPERDITVDIEFTSWKADIGSRYEIRNSTGFPVDPAVSLHGEHGVISPDAVVAPTENPNEWVIRWDVPQSHARPVVTLQKLSYVWRAGGLLEGSDLHAYKGHALGLLRGEDHGYEFASIRSRYRAVSRATLIVRLPSWAAPPSGVEVRAYDDDYTRHREEELELMRRVRQLGPGHYVLAIPYPRTGWLYALAWHPKPTSLSGLQLAFVSSAHALGARMLAAFREALSDIGAAWDLALYVPEDSQLTLVAHDSPSGNEPMRHAPMQGDRSLLAQAGWGVFHKVHGSSAAAYQLGVSPTERVVWGLPVRSLLDPDQRVLGVVRVASRTEVDRDASGKFSFALAKLLTVAS